MSLINSLFNSKKNIYIISFVLGLSLSLGFEPYSIPLIPIFIIGCFFYTNEFIYLNHFNLKVYFNAGLLFGFGFFLASLNWISNSVLEFNENLYYLIPFPLVFLPLVLSLFYGFMQIINSIFWSNSISRIFYFSASWVIIEFLRSFMFTGFPWNLLGYSWSWSLAVSQFASIFGVYGLSMLTVFCAACIFAFLRERKRYFLVLIPSLILLLIYVFGYVRLNNHQEKFLEDQVRIIHTGYSQKEKWNEESIASAINLGSQNLLTIFPETSLGIRHEMNENWFYGFLRVEKNNFYNSISYKNYIYDKKILVPFGEYFPFANQFKVLFPNIVFFNNSISKGSQSQKFTSRILPLICYESIFPNFVRDGLNNQTDLLINISNDAWFGQFSGPKQHFVHAKFRSIELGIPMARSSNSGISGIISPVGRVMEKINDEKLTYIDTKVPKKINNTIYRNFGDTMVYFLIVLFFIIGYAYDKILKREKK